MTNSYDDRSKWAYLKVADGLIHGYEVTRGSSMTTVTIRISEIASCYSKLVQEGRYIATNIVTKQQVEYLLYGKVELIEEAMRNEKSNKAP